MFKIKKKAKSKVLKRQSQQTRSKLTYITYPLYGALVFAVVGMGLWGYLRSDLIIADAYNRILAASGNVGFAIQDVKVEGRIHTPKTEIAKNLNVNLGDSIYVFNPQAARESIKSIAWVEDASVERVLPNSIRIKVTERTPKALWQNQGTHSVIDAKGVVIRGQNPVNFKDLPLIIGREAPQHSHELLEALQKFPHIQKQLKAAIHQGGSRWDLRLKSDFDVKLPDHNIEAALQKFTEIEREHGVTTKDILVIDLRSPNKLVLRLKPEAIQRKRSGEQNA